MNTHEFGNLFHHQVALCEDTLVTKEGEYAPDTDDRLSQFGLVSSLMGVPKRQAVAGMMAKHTTSIYDMATAKGTFSKEMWDEKITDHINYLILLKAVAFEELDGDGQTKLDIHVYDNAKQN